jgi:rRNA maturation RNase YbeY
MTRLLSLRNRQQVRAVETALLRRLTLRLLKEHFRPTNYEVGLHLIGASEMAQLNESFLQHKGSTDVITFDYSSEEFRVPRSAFQVGGGEQKLEPRNSKLQTPIHGEIFVCLDDAVAQAREFGTTWQSELVRYVLHGLLHLHGHDDSRPAARRKMKREENRLLRELARRFRLSKLGIRNAKRRTRTSAFRVPHSAF